MQITNSENPNKNIFNYDWEYISDRVMGGVSDGSFRFVKTENEQFYRLKGNVSTKNKGGFIQFRSSVDINSKNFKGLKFKARGTGDLYFLHIRTPFTFLPWQYYYHSFKTTKEWKIIKVPIEAFKKSNRFQPTSFSSDKIKTIGFVAYGKEFKAELDIKEIEFYK